MNKCNKRILSGIMCLLAVMGGNLAIGNSSESCCITSVYAEESMQSGTFKSGLTWSYNNRVFVVEGTGTLNEQEYLDITSKYDVGAVVIGKNVIIPMITDGDNKVCLFIDREAYPDFCNSYLYTYADSDLENKLHEVVESLAENDRKNTGSTVTAQEYLDSGRYSVNIIDISTDPFMVACKEKKDTSPTETTEVIDDMLCIYRISDKELTIIGAGELKQSTLNKIMDKYSVNTVIILGELIFENNELIKTVTNANGTEYSIYTRKDTPFYKQYAAMLKEENEPMQSSKYLLNILSEDSNDTSHIDTLNSTEEKQFATCIWDKVTIKGDADLNGEVSLSDVITIAKYNLSHNSYPLISDVAYVNADMNQDGYVNTTDLSEIIEINLGKEHK